MVPILKKLPWLFFWATIATALLLFAQTTVNMRALRLTASPTVQPCSFSVFGVDVTNKVLWACDAGAWFRTWGAPGPPTAADQVVTSSAAGAAAWGQINGGSSCGDGTHALNYTTGTHLIGCQTLTGGGGGSFVLAEQHTAANSAELDFTTCISATYDDYVVRFVDVIPVTTNVSFEMQESTNGGVSYDASAIYDLLFNQSWVNSGNNGGGSNNTAHLLGQNVQSVANYSLSGNMNFENPASASLYKMASWDIVFPNNSVGILHGVYGGVYKSATAVNAFRFLMSSGNISSGTIRCYGLTH